MIIYDHTDKAGNRGDVWKHFLLLTVLDYLLDGKNPGEKPFRYMETHAGRDKYVLPRSGEWETGIGAVAPCMETLSGHPYFRYHGPGVTAGSTYSGSWLRVITHLLARNRPASLTLCDIAAPVASAVREYTRKSPRGITVNFYREDGFAHITRMDECNLLLMDPPYHPHASRDLERLAKAVPAARQYAAAFLIWYPLRADMDAGPAVNRTGLPGHRIVWGGRTPGLQGCGMLAGGAAVPALENAAPSLESLASLLGSEYGVSRPGALIG